MKTIAGAGVRFLINPIMGTLVTGLGNPVELGQHAFWPKGSRV